jgi:uncharacterized protein YbjT (DUF2867 family)
MYAVTGITGKVGGAVASALLDAGQSVRAIVRDEEKGKTRDDQRRQAPGFRQSSSAP